MHQIQTKNGIVISYQDFGHKKAPAVILIMGLGAQMTVWPKEFYLGLVDNHFRVILFDNRDVGLSSQFDEYGCPSLFDTWINKYFSLGKPAPYTLECMADDVLNLMNELTISRAHLVGASMGGMIAQIIAAKHKQKVISLTSIMSTPGTFHLTTKSIVALLKLLPQHQTTSTHDKAIEYNVKLNQTIGSQRFLPDNVTLRHNATTQVNRAYNPNGIKRQLLAIAATGNRSQLLKKIKAPTLVIHGSEDPIFPIKAALQTAQLIQKSKLKIVTGLGHDFPPVLMAQIVQWITKHINKAENKRIKKQLNKLTK
ncbi:alpha/beta fold hydrolase [Pseudoalteromonas sp. MMG012]|uniref:alpha/beta fold hydrolase n=1 Tax=Pseudoalteromonas sp. MMG012 TaxID=2822686 RepID=UPI001B3A2BDB|nr:alpha/beta hydrolase [Pseudoalteromonas sp. MMG012]MBQ4850593.1 alpha/beta hydrolase [Pseudoalteromonas sp. MMG012]